MNRKPMKHTSKDMFASVVAEAFADAADAGRECLTLDEIIGALTRADYWSLEFLARAAARIIMDGINDHGEPIDETHKRAS